MKYMLMMHAPKGKGDWEIFNWPPQMRLCLLQISRT